MGAVGGLLTIPFELVIALLPGESLHKQPITDATKLGDALGLQGLGNTTCRGTPESCPLVLLARAALLGRGMLGGKRGDCICVVHPGHGWSSGASSGAQVLIPSGANKMAQPVCIIVFYI
jgi:hypothetical protein